MDLHKCLIFMEFHLITLTVTTITSRAQCGGKGLTMQARTLPSSWKTTIISFEWLWATFNKTFHLFLTIFLKLTFHTFIVASSQVNGLSHRQNKIQGSGNFFNSFNFLAIFLSLAASAGKSLIQFLFICSV